MPFFSRYGVEQIVHTVAQIDVGKSAPPVQGRRSLRLSVMRVTGGVLLAEVGFGFGDRQALYASVRMPSAKRAAEKSRAQAQVPEGKNRA